MSESPHARIVLVDDDDMFRESLGQNLVEAGFGVRAFASGDEALRHLLADSVADLVLLDWKMPGMNGIEVLRRLREAANAIPIIFLTALDNQIFEEAALQGGAVDFVEKSRSFSILLKRIRLIVEGAKRTNEAADQPDDESAGAVGDLHRGQLVLRRTTGRAYWKDAEVPLSITEYRMIELLATRAGKDVPYRDLYNLVHGEGFVAGYGPEGYRSNVRAFVKRIREKFREIDPDWNMIENYSGFGYRWRE